MKVNPKLICVGRNGNGHDTVRGRLSMSNKRSSYSTLSTSAFENLEPIPDWSPIAHLPYRYVVFFIPCKSLTVRRSVIRFRTDYL